jgi:hypothetical protein
MKMKNWKTILLIGGILLLVASFAAYTYRISGCYPPASIWVQFTPEQISGMKQTCEFDSPVFVQFKYFLLLFVPGMVLFSAYWLITRPTVKIRRIGMLNTFIILIMFDSLLVMFYGLLGYPFPGNARAPAAWVVEVIAFLGFLCYLSTLALWHWKRWGLMLFQGASVALAVFLLLGGQSLILAAVIIAGVLGLSLLLRPVRNKMV